MKQIATCCFTGHRPEKLNVPEKIVIRKLKDAIEDAYADGFTNYISGMSRGVDLWAADLVIELRKEYQNVKLICAVPYEGFEKEWSQGLQDRYQEILLAADEVHYICENYSRGSYQKRNEWMIDHASMVIAGYTGAKGGTRNTLEYAKKQDDYTIRLLDL